MNYGARVKSDNELLAYLRTSVAGSVMPAYGFLYTQSKDGSFRPTEDAVALVAYLKSLKIDYSSPEAKLKQ
jgi:cbb3-type cytochrome oxidase cytochrome c subunit